VKIGRNKDANFYFVALCVRVHVNEKKRYYIVPVTADDSL
jgi:hypothetical protein